VRRNVAWLREQGYRFAGPVHGRVACGETGEGHLATDSEIIGEIAGLRAASGAGPLAGRAVLISAGPMRTALDPVRFIQNRSSGRMGWELARVCRAQGARVTVLLGPVSEDMRARLAEFEVHPYVGASDYAAALAQLWPRQDVFFSAAAVLDFESEAAPAKIERERIAAHPELSLRIRPVPDLVAGAAASRRPGQVVVAFAAESGTEEEILARARNKLLKKAAHALIANPVWEGLGPDAAYNRVWVLTPGSGPISLGPDAKAALAAPILQTLAPVFKKIFAESEAKSGARSRVLSPRSERPSPSPGR
jgi:phosphopantothenoylcysteine decarboxylase/phosphopantothenate--cysteine ligase